MGVVDAHGFAGVGDQEMVKECQASAVERCHDQHRRFAGELQTVFAQGGIAAPVVAVLNPPVRAPTPAVARVRRGWRGRW